jgi:hypothetical protein
VKVSPSTTVITLTISPRDERRLSFHQTERMVRTASVMQVRQKLYTGSWEAWRKFEKHLAPLVEALRSWDLI